MDLYEPTTPETVAEKQAAVQAYLDWLLPYL